MSETVSSPMAARTRSQVKRKSSSAYSSPPLFHKSAQLQTSILQQYQAHPKLFIERKIKEETMEKIYKLVQYWMLKENLLLSSLAKMLEGIHKELNFVAFHDGAWWKMGRKVSQTPYKWRKQTVIFDSNGRHLINDVLETTLNDSFKPNVISCAIYSKGESPGLRVMKWPHFGTSESLRYDFDGTEKEMPLCQEDLKKITEELKAWGIPTPEELVWHTQDASQPTNSNPGSNATNMSQSGPELDTQTSILDYFSSQSQPVASTTQDAPPAPIQPSTQDTGDQVSQETQSATEEPPAEEVHQSTDGEGLNTPVSAVGDGNNQDHTEATQPTTEADRVVTNQTKTNDKPAGGSNKKIDTIRCDRFQKPNGLVPRIIYGLRGQRLIKLLTKNSQMNGNKLLLTWLNSTRAFERPRVISNDQVKEDTIERRNRISTRKFQYGNIGASWRALSKGIMGKITPTEEQIAALFPNSASDQELEYKCTGTTRLSISREELEYVLSKLPRDRACGISQLSYDHIRYAATRDEVVFDMLLETLNFMLNNPAQVDAHAFTAQAYFLPKKDGKVRPIVLQECLTKILHKCINTRILNAIRTTMTPNQYCINNRNGTCAAALHIQRSISEKKFKFFASIDFTNAFNSLSRDIIVKNLEKLEIGKGYIAYIVNYLNKFKIKYGDKVIKNRRGVPQGCPLSMTLFSIGTSHMLEKLESDGIDVSAYADDIVIGAETEEKLLKALHDLKDMASQIGLQLNEEKTHLYSSERNCSGQFKSLWDTTWVYLGIPISQDKERVRQAFAEFIDDVAESAKQAWNAPSLEQGYFINRLCVNPRIIHIARGTNLDESDEAFFERQQQKIDDQLPGLMKKVEKIYRILPVADGGLGLTDLSIVAKAARSALLIETNSRAPTREEEDIIKNHIEKTKKEGKLQQLFTRAYRNVILDEHKYEMTVQGPKKPAPFTGSFADSIWLSQCPRNPSQTLSNMAFSIAIQLRYSLDPLENSNLKCPFCGKAISLKHCLVCMRANTGPIVNRHNTITRIIGCALASRGTVAHYEQKPVSHKDVPHIPDITYHKDVEIHYIDVAVTYADPRGQRLRDVKSRKHTAYKSSRGTIPNNLHVVSFDNDAHIGEGVYDYLKSIGCTGAMVKAMQKCILSTNETCFRKVMARIAESKNLCKLNGNKNLLISLNQIDDMIALN